MCSSATARPTSAIRRRSLLSSVPSYGWHRDAEARQDYLRCSDGQERLGPHSFLVPLYKFAHCCDLNRCIDAAVSADLSRRNLFYE